MKPVRRVVTGHNKDGASVFLHDSEIGDVFSGKANMQLAELWADNETPVDNSGDQDKARHRFSLEPDVGGNLFRVFEMPPEPEGTAQPGKGVDSHPGFHITDTVDYIIVLRGEVYSMMETGETLLKAGDVLIQRGTNHAWSNRSGEPCLMAAIMVSAKPL